MLDTAAPLKAPLPYFGGKRTVAPIIWEALGDAPNYVEPFAGSLAVLLARPHPPRTETVNDADGWVANTWRAIALRPDEVAKWADWPVSELDLSARKTWCAAHPPDVEAMRADPLYCCPQRAGWWIWGMCASIGDSWGRGINRQIPHLGNRGQGINRQIPHLGDRGQGINRQIPHLGDRGQYIRDTMAALSARLRDVRICCGDWSRVLAPSVTTRHGITAVFLDPPYAATECESVYAHNHPALFADVCRWCETHGDDPLLRIALCGYAGTWPPPSNWRSVEWRANGGYGLQGSGRGRVNRERETIWLSPHCLGSGRAVQANLWEVT